MPDVRGDMPDFRGALPPELMLGAGVGGGGGGGGAPSLLQMMQGMGGGGRGYAPMPQNIPTAEFGTWAAQSPQYVADRAAWSNRNTADFKLSSPDDAKYFDASGLPRADDPQKVAADAGISMQQLAGGLMPRYGDRYGQWGQGYDYPNDKGGFFKIEDLYRDNPRGVPQSATFGQGGLSTNNWRLLGMGPGWIMRNGALIDTQSSGGRWGGPAGWTPSGGNSGEQSMLATQTALGAGAGYGVPNMLQAGLGMPVTYGWPGAASGWLNAGMTSEG